MRNFLVLAAACIAVLWAAPAFAQSAAPALPKQDIVFVIDNSTSMEMPPTASDPLRLRGVAAGLMLDAVEVSSEVRAGLVVFGDDSITDGQLHQDTGWVRDRLRPARLSDPQGSTNMLDALTKALAMFRGSPADRKRIVLITDGAPNPGQGPVIVQTLVPNAKSAGIQIFALGLSENVDQKFLDEVTKGTGGKTLVARTHTQLLDLAKELVGDLDNVYTLARQSLPSTTMEYEFPLGSGANRARLTAILDQPTEFSPDQIEFTLTGPDPGIPYDYQIRPQGNDRVAAWTSFFSKPGKYKLQIRVTKPGVSGHQGMRLVLEALSNLRAQVTLTPAASVRRFGETIRVDVTALTPSGTLNPGDLKVTGVVETVSGGSTTIAFSGMQGTFEVPAVDGRHTVIVRVQSELSQAQARAGYDAFHEPPPSLKSSRDLLKFAKAFGPADPTIAESFKLYAEFPEGLPTREVKVSFTVISPAGVAELVTSSGSAMRSGVTQHSLPPAGLELVLRIRMDPKNRVPEKGGKYAGEIRVESTEAPPLVIPFEFEFRVPQFEIRHKRAAFSLWWDPYRERIVNLGALHTDLAARSTFFVVLPDAIYAPDQGPKIADLSLRLSNPVEPEHIEEGKLRYGPLELDPGKNFDVNVVVTPTPVTAWERLPARPQTIDVRFESDLGMKTSIAPVFWSIGGSFHEIPLFGTWSRHGRHWSTVLFSLFALAVLTAGAMRRIRAVKSYWPYRPGSLLMLRSFGSIQVGEVTENSGAALVLPNTGSLLDNTTLGHVYADARGQRVEDSSGHLVPLHGRLSAGDALGVLDPLDPAGEIKLWDFDYSDFAPNEGGDLVVSKSPAPWTLKRLMRWLAINAIALAALLMLWRSSYAASAAYSVLRFVESIYLHLLQS